MQTMAARDVALTPPIRAVTRLLEAEAGADDLRPLLWFLRRSDREKAAQSLPARHASSFGTAGCNLTCRFCQNWDISKAREFDRLTEQASPEAIADAAVDSGCRSVAFTYNDPVVFVEYAIDVAQACRSRGLKTVSVSAGYRDPGLSSTPARSDMDRTTST
jgi:Radical SAM superfamily/4Fe-4S single cluster domain